jgi:hypothetical protein
LHHLSFFSVIPVVHQMTPQKKLRKINHQWIPKCQWAENKSHDLKIAMNKLWEDHVTRTRNVILCLVDGVPGIDQDSKTPDAKPG